MKTRDEVIRDLAYHAQDQCDALNDKMTFIISGYDEDNERDEEALCGITRDRDNRSMLAFAKSGTTEAITIVYVDAILALAKLLNGEVQVQDD